MLDTYHRPPSETETSSPQGAPAATGAKNDDDVGLWIECVCGRIGKVAGKQQIYILSNFALCANFLFSLNMYNSSNFKYYFVWLTDWCP